MARFDPGQVSGGAVAVMIGGLHGYIIGQGVAWIIDQGGRCPYCHESIRAEEHRGAPQCPYCQRALPVEDLGYKLTHRSTRDRYQR